MRNYADKTVPGLFENQSVEDPVNKDCDHIVKKQTEIPDGAMACGEQCGRNHGAQPKRKTFMDLPKKKPRQAISSPKRCKRDLEYQKRRLIKGQQGAGALNHMSAQCAFEEKNSDKAKPQLRLGSGAIPERTPTAFSCSRSVLLSAL